MPKGLDLPPEITTPLPSAIRGDTRRYYPRDSDAMASRHPLTGDPPDYAYHVPGAGWSPRWHVDPMKSRPNQMLWWYRLREVSELVGIDPKTLRRAIKEGRLEAYRPFGPRGHCFVRGDMLDRFMRGLPPLNRSREELYA